MGKGVLTGIAVALVVLGAPAVAAAEADTTPPRTNILMTSDTGSGAHLWFFVPGEIPAQIECRVDDRPFASCMKPGTGQDWDTGALPSGFHVAQLRATDFAGNVEDPPASHVFYVRPQPPDVYFAGNAWPNAGYWTNDPTPALRMETSDTGVASFTCGIDTDVPAPDGSTPAPEACGREWSPAEPLDDGPHTLSVGAIDRNGVLSSARSFGFWVDTREPTLSLIVPGRVIAGTPVKLKIVAYDENHSDRLCTLDRKPIKCRPQTRKHLSVGAHRVEVQIEDRAGNEASAEATIRVSRR